MPKTRSAGSLELINRFSILAVLFFCICLWLFDSSTSTRLGEALPKIA